MKQHIICCITLKSYQALTLRLCFRYTVHFQLTCNRAVCPHTLPRWSRGFWGMRRRADGTALYLCKSTQRWIPLSQTQDSWSHNPPLWVCLEHSTRLCSPRSRHTPKRDTHPPAPGTRWPAGMTGAAWRERERKGWNTRWHFNKTIFFLF